jgi:hypothetical protein
MEPIVSKNPLVIKIAEGGANAELLEYLLERKLAFTEEEYLESLVFVLADAVHRDHARTGLARIPLSVRVNYAQKREAHPRVAEFILEEALQSDQLDALTAIMQNPRLPIEFLLRIAGEGRAAALEILLENQVRLIAYPEILDQIERNPECNPFVRGKINELREFYLTSATVEAIPEEDVLKDLERMSSQDAGAEQDDSPVIIQQKTLTALQRINHMTISQRIRLALTGDKTERMILIKDPSRMVQLAVIDSPKMADDEALIHARNFSISGEIVAKIAANREWTKNYTIVLALVQNPKTPISRAVSFIKMLHVRDLKQLIQDRNINPVIRNLATNLQKEKERVKG